MNDRPEPVPDVNPASDNSQTGSQLVPGANRYCEALCGLPGCRETLFITWSASRAVYLNDTARELADPSTAHTTSWQVECGAGHVVLLSPDTAADNYEFGACGCTAMGDYPADEVLCGHNDMDRLRRVTAPAVAAAPGTSDSDQP